MKKKAILATFISIFMSSIVAEKATRKQEAILTNLRYDKNGIFRFSFIAGKCDMDFSLDCYQLTEAINAAMKHYNILKEIQKVKNILEHVQDEKSKKVLESILQQKKNAYPFHNIQDYRATLSDEQYTQIDDAIKNLLTPRIPLSISTIEKESERIDEILSGK